MTIATHKMTNTNRHADSNKPWYRQPWLVFIISIPVCSILLSGIMVYVAIDGGDSLVSDNYYKDGLAINQTLEQDQLADKLGLHPVVTVDPNGVVSVEIQSDKIEPQAFLTLKLLHPTISSADVIVKLLPTDSAYIGDIPAGLEGRRYLDLYSYDASWRIRETVILPLKQHVLNLP